MDISLLLSAGMMSCGRVMKVLPQSEIKSPQEYMMKVIRNQLLPALDVIYPRLLPPKTFRVEMLTKVNDGDGIFQDAALQGMDSRYNAFRVPSQLLDGCRMLGIKNWHETYSTVNTDNGLYGVGLGNMYPNRWGRFSSANVYARAFGNMVNYADAQLMGTMKPSLRMKYYPPNIVMINKPYADIPDMCITCTFKVGNDENLITVPDVAYMAIKDLFILYLKERIYTEYSMFSEIDTTTGNPVNLGISDWSSAESDAAQKFADLQATAHFRNTSMMSG